MICEKTINMVWIYRDKKKHNSSYYKYTNSSGNMNSHITVECQCHITVANTDSTEVNCCSCSVGRKYFRWLLSAVKKEWRVCEAKCTFVCNISIRNCCCLIHGIFPCSQFKILSCFLTTLFSTYARSIVHTGNVHIVPKEKFKKIKPDVLK
jgi:hypothetical protein